MRTRRVWRGTPTDETCAEGGVEQRSVLIFLVVAAEEENWYTTSTGSICHTSYGKSQLVEAADGVGGLAGGVRRPSCRGKLAAKHLTGFKLCGFAGCKNWVNRRRILLLRCVVR